MVIAMLNINKIYQKNLKDLLEELNTNLSGLSQAQVLDNLNKYGSNNIKTPLFYRLKKVLFPLFNIFTILLFIAGVLNYFFDEKSSAIFIFICIIINALIQFIETYHIGRIINALKSELNVRVMTLRDSKILQIFSQDLVIGDIVVMKAGEIAAADLRIVKAKDCLVDQAIITGESELISKTAELNSGPEDLEIYLQSNMLWSGSRLVSGSLTAVVVGVGSTSYIGSLSNDLGNIRKSYFQDKLDKIIGKILFALSLISAGVFALSLMRGMEFLEAMKFSTIVLVAAVPEGLILGTTLVFAISIGRISKYNGLVKDFRSLEDLGLISMAVFDKTGTLTTGELQLIAIDLIKSGKDFDLTNFILINDAGIAEDPLDQALEKYLGDSDKTRQQQDFVKIYFNQQYRLSGNLNIKLQHMYLKGAPEYIVKYCVESKDLAREIIQKTKKEMQKGRRTLIIAELAIEQEYQSLEKLFSKNKNFKLISLGVLIYSEELNKKSALAIENLAKIAVQSKLVTGDHAISAQAIAAELKIINSEEEVFSSDKLSSTQKFNKALLNKLNKVKVFARTLPHQKKELVNIWQKNHVVAFVGDGVNDMLSLENSAVGISFLDSSEIAKSSAGIILRDHNLNLLYQAINFSRQTIRNAQKMIFFILVTNLSEVLLIVFALAIGLPSPITPLQLLWINIITDTIITLPIGVFWPKKESYNKINNDILSGHQIINIFILGSINALLLVLAVAFYNQIGLEHRVIQDYVFIAIMIGQGCLALVFRSLNNKLDKIRIWQNKLLISVILLLILVHAIFIKYGLFGFLISKQTPISDAVLFGLVIGLIISLCASILKRSN